MSLTARAEAQPATYSDHWLEEQSLVEAPENWTSPEYSVGTTDSSYDPYVEYQVELKMYDGDSLVERVWSSWNPTYASAVGTAYIVPDIIHTPIANCVEVDHYIKKHLQDVIEKFARTASESQLERIETRYGLVGKRDDGLYEWVRDECYAACQHGKFCTPTGGGGIYLRGYGVLVSAPGSNFAMCTINHKSQALRPGCQGPTGLPITGSNGCPDG